MLTDDSWKLLSRIMHLTGRIYNKPEHRMTHEGILFRMRTGCNGQLILATVLESLYLTLDSFGARLAF